MDPVSGVDAHELLATMLHRVAPDVDLETIEPDELLQEAADLDSMDFLNLLAVLHQLTGLDVPERDYPQLTTVARVEEYLAAHVDGQAGAMRPA